MINRNIAMRRVAWTAALVSSALLLAACTGHKKDATQSAARVNGSEITVHQINYRLQRERGLRPEQMDEESRKILRQLVDEQLIVDRVEKTKMDQEPGAQQAMDAARREVLARAYVEQAAQAVPGPTETAMKNYFDSNDALFAHRRVYVLQEYLAKVPEDKIPALRAVVDGGKSPSDAEGWFKAQATPFRGQQSTHPAEQIPLSSLQTLAALQNGHGVVSSSGDQVHVTYVTSSTDAPVTFDKAKPAIAQFLTVEARRKATEGNLGALRSVAKITYSAPYEALAASASSFSLKDVEAASQAAQTPGTRIALPVNAASGVQVSLPSVNATPGVRVSLPATPASSVEVRLPPQTSAEAGKK